MHSGSGFLQEQLQAPAWEGESSPQTAFWSPNYTSMLLAQAEHPSPEQALRSIS